MAGCQRVETLTAEQRSARGQTMLRQMSQSAANFRVFSYTAEEHRDKVQPGGAKTTETATRHVTVRRPNGLAYTGDQSSAWYDGKAVTFVSHRNKAWARGPMPPTLDEAMDFLSAEYAVQIPTADLLYSNPYDALMGPDTKGGWVDVQDVGDTPCDHLAYSQDVVDWEIWLTQDERRMPRQVKITYKKEPGAPSTRVVFSDFNASPQVSDDTFVAKVPDGYERLKIMRHATVEDKTVSEAQPAATPAAKAAAPKKP
jgi:hypothetical protein